jgi:transcriptional regulator EpsA
MTNLPQQEVGEHLMSVIVECTEVQTATDFSQVIEGSFCQVFPHEMMVCGIGGLSNLGGDVHKMLNLHYPRDYFDAMRHADGRLDSPLMKKWRESLEPVWFQSGRDDHDFPEEWVQLFNKHDLRNTIGHGVLDLTGAFSSYFIFSRMPGEVGPEHAFLLKILTPHLHLALARAQSTIDEFDSGLAKTRKLLSPRQREIIHWLHEGKTNWEIAKILNLSEPNVKYHIDQIFLKLEVRTRAHAVAKALDLGLLLPPRT